jgi:hypothetical protein
MKLIPIYDDTAPITCTAASDGIPVRIEQIERLRSHHTRLERTEHGLLLHFPDQPDVRTELEQFTVEEKGCCAFWGFAIDADGDDLTLRWDGPPTVDELMGRLVAFFASDEPLTANSGLL